MNIWIKNTQKKKRLPLAALKKRLAQLLKKELKAETGLSVLFVGDRAMRSLNRDWRGKDAATDVLSFSLQEGRFPGVQSTLLGDIVISVPVASRQAAACGHSLNAEIDRLLVHGIAHLLGYDHERGPAEEKRMQRKERQLLASLSA